MKTLVEIRVPDDWAAHEYGPSLGEVLYVNEIPVVRRIVLETSNPRLADLKSRLCRDRQKPAVIVRREYTPEEILSAELFQLIITGCFHLDACGEDFGTEYDDSNACSKCGAGRIQRSPLRLDLSLAPVELDIATTIAMNEWVVSTRLVHLMQAHQITGYRVQQVEHKGKKPPKERWYQLIVPGKVGHTVDPTHFGISYFEEDAQGTYTCPEHLLSGLRILSEAFVSRRNIEYVDMAITSNRKGIRSGVLMPTPLILISRRFHQLIINNKIQGCEQEIAHIVD